MIYLEETLTLEPPSPETLDTFVAFAQERLPPLERDGLPPGGRLVQRHQSRSARLFRCSSSRAWSRSRSSAPERSTRSPGWTT